MPSVEKARYFSLQFVDWNTFNYGYMVMRLYWPKTEAPSILPPGEGTWAPPGYREGKLASILPIRNVRAEMIGPTASSPVSWGIPTNPAARWLIHLHSFVDILLRYVHG